jgi:hypothetical protein
MDERPPFDPVRACFLLVAAVIAVHCIIVLAGAAMCVVEWRDMPLIDGKRCDPSSRLGDLLAGALAAALGFAAGLMRGSGPPPPPKE